MRRRLGIFGGTFDPPHHGHLLVASDAYDALELDQLLFVPAANPPHKQGEVVASAGQRLAMLEAAIGGDERFRADDIEIRRAGVSYTVDTLRAIGARHPETELVFLLGVDQFRVLSSWREPGAVARLARLAVLARAGETLDLSGPYRGDPVPVRRIDISATEVRRRLAAGQTVRYLLPDSVRAIIEKEGLYRTP